MSLTEQITRAYHKWVAGKQAGSGDGFRAGAQWMLREIRRNPSKFRLIDPQKVMDAG